MNRIPVVIGTHVVLKALRLKHSLIRGVLYALGGVFHRQVLR